VIGGGADAGSRALLGALNKLNERNFEAIRSRVCELIDAGSVDPAKAALAIISKSCDDATYAHTFAKLLSNVSAKSGDALAEALGLVTGLFPAARETRRHPDDEKDEEEDEEEGRSMLVAEIFRVSEAIDSPDATPEAGYDAFCAAMRGKRRLLGRTSSALAVISLMASELSALSKTRQEEDDDLPRFPRPRDVARTIVEAVRRAADAGPSGGVDRELMKKERNGDTAIDLALDVGVQLVGMLRASEIPSHVSALAALRAGIREIMDGSPRSADASPKIRFKVQDLLQQTRGASGGPKNGAAVTPATASANIRSASAVRSGASHQGGFSGGNGGGRSAAPGGRPPRGKR
jgi:hypothetical protein